MTGVTGTSPDGSLGASFTGTAADAATPASDRTSIEALAGLTGDGIGSGREAGVAPRADREADSRGRDGLLVADFVARAGLASDDEPEPVEPADPVVSAKALGIAAIPAPTPRAKASAPTRPI